jgi:hypothetical protein
VSWKASAFVKELTHTPSGRKLLPSEKCLLYTLADYYDEERGNAWPSMDRLGTESLVSSRQCRRLIRALEKDQILIVESGDKGKSNRYRFVNYVKKGTDNLSYPVLAKATPDVRGGRTQLCPGGADIAMSAEPPIQPEVEPSLPASKNPKPGGDKKPLKPPKQEKPKDERQKTFQKVIEEVQKSISGHDVYWDARCAGALAQFLKRTPGLKEEGLRLWLKNYFDSDTNPADPPMIYLHQLERYRLGPLDRFGKPVVRKTRTRNADTLAEKSRQDIERTSPLLRPEDYRSDE